MATTRVLEAIDILEYRAFSLTPCVPFVAPDQLSFDGFEECFDHGIVVTVTFAAHRDFEPMLFQAL